jgi:hypothetical protein
MPVVATDIALTEPDAKLFKVSSKMKVIDRAHGTSGRPRER